MTTHQNTISVFLSYAHEDEPLLRKLEAHLNLLIQQGLISIWHDRRIVPGTNWANVIDERLEQATIILLLVSPDFLASNYCYQVEMKRALELDRDGAARVIPIAMRPVDWENAPFAHLQALPTDAKPISTWSDQDEALANVVNGVRQVIKDLSFVHQEGKVLLQKSTGPVLWYVPYSRNLVFTNREMFLEELYNKLVTMQMAALTQTQFISGLGGIGKTQIALEYAYRHRNDYRYILWVGAATVENLLTDFARLAERLEIQTANNQDLHSIIEAIKSWLAQQRDWLLILDNADELDSVVQYIPNVVGTNGHILLTTRVSATGGIALPMEVEKMNQRDAVVLLLRRTGLLTVGETLEQVPAQSRSEAEAIVTELDGLPLALDQAGAYIQETGCGLAAYLTFYTKHRQDLLARRGRLAQDHPEPVATTWSLSFEKIVQENAAAGDLLRLCAFLAPDAIPEELFSVGAKGLGIILAPVAADEFQLNEALGVLFRYSLVKRNAEEKTVSVHRLVQAVLIDTMDSQIQRVWAESALYAVNSVFPESEYKTWPQCRRYLTQAQAALVASERYQLVSPEAIRLFIQAGYYLYDHAFHEQAERFLQRALAMSKRVKPAKRLTIALAYHHLALLYHVQKRSEEAEIAYGKALKTRERMLSKDHADTIKTQHHLARLYQDQGRYEDATALYQEVLDARVRVLGEEHGDTARTEHQLATLYQELGKDKEAEELYREALRVKKQVLGEDHSSTALTEHYLASLYQKQGKYDKAELLYKHALNVEEKTLGSDHYRTVRTMHRYVNLLRATQREEEAAALEARINQNEKDV